MLFSIIIAVLTMAFVRIVFKRERKLVQFAIGLGLSSAAMFVIYTIYLTLTVS